MPYLIVVHVLSSMKILHFSDIHITVDKADIRWSKLLNKRLVGILNLLLNRGEEFDTAKEKVEALIEFKKKHNIKQ